jgi:hypothetical protein
VGGRPGLVRGGAEARTLFIYSSPLSLSSPLRLLASARRRPCATMEDTRAGFDDEHTPPVIASPGPPPPAAYRHRHPLIHGTTATTLHPARPPSATTTTSPSSSSLAIAARHDFTTKKTNTKTQINKKQQLKVTYENLYFSIKQIIKTKKNEGKIKIQKLFKLVFIYLFYTTNCFLYCCWRSQWK